MSRGPANRWILGSTFMVLGYPTRFWMRCTTTGNNTVSSNFSSSALSFLAAVVLVRQTEKQRHAAWAGFGLAEWGLACCHDCHELPRILLRRLRNHRLSRRRRHYYIVQWCDRPMVDSRPKTDFVT